MLIGFIGCPSSGKTTTAAMAFADLKNMGVSSEFIPEQARMYIAEMRLVLRLPPGSTVPLTDNDQFQILQKQMDSEKMLVQSSGPGVVVITDSSAFNTLLYMKPRFRELVRQIVIEHLKTYDLLFYCAPVKMPKVLDPNRVHNEQQALEIDRMIPDLLKEYDVKSIYLLGDSHQRHHQVTRAILEKLVA